VAVELGSGMVREAILTGAEIGDSLAADALVQGDEAAGLMDKAYDSAARREALSAAGIADGIMHRADARRPLAPSQRWMSRMPVRGEVDLAIASRLRGRDTVRFLPLPRSSRRASTGSQARPRSPGAKCCGAGSLPFRPEATASRRSMTGLSAPA
jgi:IS5 family transposase